MPDDPEYVSVDFTPRHTIAWYDPSLPTVNTPSFSIGRAKLEKMSHKPRYGSLLNWLFRRPQFYEVTATFTIQPEASDAAL